MSMRKSIAGIVACASAIAILAGCGAGNGGASSGAAGGDKPSAPKEEALDLSKVEYGVESTTIDNRRMLALSYTNGTSATIVAIELKYRQKDGVTDDQRAAAFSQLREGAGMDDEGYANVKDLGLSCVNNLIVEPGGKAENTHCSVGNWYAIGDFLPIMEPDMMTVAYLKDGGAKVGKATYDFVNKKTNLDKEEKKADGWGDDALTAMLPKPESTIISQQLVNDGYVSYYAYGITQDQYSTYLDSCRGKGFADDGVFDTSAYLNGPNGERLSLSYDAEDESLSVQLAKE